MNCLSRISKVEFSCIGFHTIDRMMAILPENTEILNLLGILKYNYSYLEVKLFSYTELNNNSKFNF